MSARPTRGRGGRAASSGRNSATPFSAESTPTAEGSDAGAAAQPSNLSSRTAARGSGSRASASASGSRHVGGLLGESSEYARKPAGTGRVSQSKLKFVPNTKKKPRPKAAGDDDDDEDNVKMEDDEKRPARPARARAPRQELQMTATGAFAAGPGGIPRGFTPRANHGPEGAGVMDASRLGIVRGQYDRDDDGDLDYSHSEAGSDDERGDGGRAEGAGARGERKTLAYELDLIGNEHEMSPTVLPADPTVLRLATERRKKRKEARIKAEQKKVKSEPDADEDGMTSGDVSRVGTPMTIDSKVDALDSKEATMEVDSKEPTVEPDRKPDIKEEDEKVGADMLAMFDAQLQMGEVSELFLFQFGRKFPNLVPAEGAPDLDAMVQAVDTKVKLEEGGGGSGSASSAAQAAKRARTAPGWGRAGTRLQKAARWPAVEGKMGEMKVHKSGKVTLTVADGLTYEVVPAAQPSFLQEVVVLDQQDPKAEDSKDDKLRPRRIEAMGQTNRKLMVMPNVDELLDKVAEQVKEEKRAEAAAKKSVKKEKVKGE